MGVGRVCGIHNEWCADGNCRWCEPLPEPVVGTGWYTVNTTCQPYRISGEVVREHTKPKAVYHRCACGLLYIGGADWPDPYTEKSGAVHSVRGCMSAPLTAIRE